MSDTPIVIEGTPYFKAGETVTVEAAKNGFYIYTEDGNIVAGEINGMLQAVLHALTNHEEYAAVAEANKAAASDADDEAEAA